MPAAPSLPLLRQLPVLCAIAACACALPATAEAKTSASLKASPKMSKTFMKRYHVKSATADPDHDGLTNFTEFRAHTNPKKADTDRDGVSDALEDFDHDGLTNLTEQRAGTNPGVRDSDHDGVSDAREDSDHDGLTNLAEQQTANDPGDPDSDDDGVKDGAEGAGQVVSFADDGTLVIRLAANPKVTVTGVVDDDTEVQCGATADWEDGYDDGAAQDTQSALAGDDDTQFTDDPGDDDADAGDDDSADDADDDATATDSRFVRADDDTDDDTSDGSDDSADDDAPAGADTCISATLDKGAWVHESALSQDDDGANVFDTLSLVSDDDGE